MRLTTTVVGLLILYVALACANAAGNKSIITHVPFAENMKKLPRIQSTEPPPSKLMPPVPPPKLKSPPGSAPLPPPAKVSRHIYDLAGLPVNVYGLDELSKKVQGKAPPVAVVIFLHGRTRSALIEDFLVRILYGNIRKHMDANPAGSTKDLLMVSFDARNHGNRSTNSHEMLGLDKNPGFLYDHYAMIRGYRDDVSFIIDQLPTFVFPNEERVITSWTVSGKSLGGHASWHILKGAHSAH